MQHSYTQSQQSEIINLIIKHQAVARDAGKTKTAAVIAIHGPYHPYCPKDHGSRKKKSEKPKTA